MLAPAASRPSLGDSLPGSSTSLTVISLSGSGLQLSQNFAERACRLHVLSDGGGPVGQRSDSSPKCFKTSDNAKSSMTQCPLSQSLR